MYFWKCWCTSCLSKQRYDEITKGPVFYETRCIMSASAKQGGHNYGSWVILSQGSWSIDRCGCAAFSLVISTFWYVPTIVTPSPRFANGRPIHGGVEDRLPSDESRSAGDVESLLVSIAVSNGRANDWPKCVFKATALNRTWFIIWTRCSSCHCAPA